jgi:uncharacterized membrane protein YhfC
VAFVVALLIEIVMPFVAGFWAESKLDVPWRAFWYGALVYGLAELAVRLPLLNLAAGPLAPAESGDVPAVLLWTAVLAGSTALVELAGRYLGFRFLLRDLGRSWETAVMLGLGMAAMESLLLVGLPTLLTFVNALSLPGMNAESLGLTAEQAQQLAAAKTELAALSPLVPLSAAVERILAMFLQVSLAVLALQAFTRLSRRWLWYSAAMQFGVGMAVTIASDFSSVLVAEIVLAACAAAAFYWALRLREPPPARARARA